MSLRDRAVWLAAIMALLVIHVVVRNTATKVESFIDDSHAFTVSSTLKESLPVAELLPVWLVEHVVIGHSQVNGNIRIAVLEIEILLLGKEDTDHRAQSVDFSFGDLPIPERGNSDTAHECRS
jgi:hypothetical protein